MVRLSMLQVVIISYVVEVWSLENVRSTVPDEMVMQGIHEQIDLF